MAGQVMIDCPPHLVGLLIGKKGWTIKKIQQETGAQVRAAIHDRVGERHKDSPGATSTLSVATPQPPNPTLTPDPKSRLTSGPP